MHRVDAARAGRSAPADPHAAVVRTHAMLWLRRAVTVPSLAAARSVSFLLHHGLRAYVVRTRGVVHEKRLYGGTALGGATARRLVQVVLAGRLRLDDGARTAWLDAGSISSQPHGLDGERWEGEPFVALVVDWEPTPGERVPSWTVARLSAAELTRARAWAETLEAATAPPGAQAALTLELLAWVRSLGETPPERDTASLLAPIPPATRALAGAFGDALSELAGRPMLVDLERALARSGRHLRRDFAALDRYYAFPGGTSWHRVLHQWRLSVATCLMTAPRATTEGVAAILGYGSPRAFCLAMHQAGLPSPGAIAAAAARLA
jgi:hypothetical protein